MRKSMVAITILAVFLLCGGCASTGEKHNTTASTAPSVEENAPLAAPSEESANNGDEGVAGAVKETAAKVKKVMKKAVDETAVAFNETAKDIGHEAKKFGKAAAGEMNNIDLSPLKKVAAAAANGVKANGSFPWWIIILLIILIIIWIMTRPREKKS